MTAPPAYEHFPHGADVGVRGFGRSRAEAFEQAALALTATVTEPGNITAADDIEIQCAAPDSELLLNDWLNAVVYEMASRDMLFGRFEVRIDNGRLQGRARGEHLDVARHDPAVEVKGATLTSLRVAPEDDGTWLAQCIIDV